MFHKDPEIHNKISQREIQNEVMKQYLAKPRKTCDVVSDLQAL